MSTKQRSPCYHRGAMDDKPKHNIFNEVSEALSADVLICNSGIERDLDEEIIKMCYGRRRRKNIALILVTEGGSPDAAYRIARTLQCLYERFYCVISGYCKSAGTLLALGANELIFGHHGELGPLDIQMAKKDELMESESGLTVMTALTALHEKAMLAFEHFFLETTFHSGGRISVRTASQIATELTKALFGPISSQIDPIHVGEAWRSMTIAKAYGERLMKKGQNFTPDKLDELISQYPSHGFVIDRLEAEKIFKHVREADSAEQSLLELLGIMAISPSSIQFVRFLSKELPEETKEIPDGNQEVPGENNNGGDAKTASEQQPNSDAPSQTGGDVEANPNDAPDHASE